ncbi:hypothetical protein [Legionella sp. km772]|uniref:hypothetical protein n=1 Tax=Legionella sp. km772 TaxID=2498111 RepID=UPI000F8C6148|nr:hypothetical protein [Legionella sp. km772]RUR13523.1 hypothetical protein ELY15_02145 [Legionella sp. km772]
MSLKNDDNALNPKDLVFILALAGRIDAQSRILAEELDKGRHVYYAYSVLDSLSSSYSMFKYFFDVYFAGTTDEMHELMLSPAGIAGITLESLFLVSFSFLACHFDKEKEDNYKKWIADAWPYFRDVLKGLKNAYKGWRSTVAAMNLLGITDASMLVLPVGLALGVVGAANRYLIRHLREARKDMMVNNRKLFLALAKLPSLTKEGLDNFYQEHGAIQYQTDTERYLGFVSAAMGGVIDGLYLYVGVLTLSVFAPQLLIAMASLCVFYTLACIVTRVYEEYEFQQKLMITQTKCLLAIDTKQIQTLYAQLLLLEAKTNKTAEDLLKIAGLKTDLAKLIDHFETQRQLLRLQSSTGLLSSMLTGLKHGLYAYGALSSVLFLTSAILTMIGIAFPPAVVVATVFIGLALIAGFIGHALWVNAQHTKKQNASDDSSYQMLLAMKGQLGLSSTESRLLTVEQLNASLKNGLSVESAPVHFFQEWFEVFRSFFSGLSKGQKFVDFAGNPLQEMGEDGHYHDTPVMYVLGALSALLFGFILALRALARGFGRAALDSNKDLVSAAEVPVRTNDLIEEQTDKTVIHSGPSKTKGEGESIHVVTRNDSPKNSGRLLPLFGFFGSKDKALSRAQSVNELNALATSESNTILGLG